MVVWLLSLLLLRGGGSDGWVLLMESALCGGGVENGLRIRHDVGFGLIGGDRLVKQDLASTGAVRRERSEKRAKALRKDEEDEERDCRLCTLAPVRASERASAEVW